MGRGRWPGGPRLRPDLRSKEGGLSPRWLSPQASLPHSVLQPCPAPFLPCPRGFRQTSLGKTALGKKQNGSKRTALLKKCFSCWSFESCNDRWLPCPLRALPAAGGRVLRPPGSEPVRQPCQQLRATHHRSTSRSPDKVAGCSGAQGRPVPWGRPRSGVRPSGQNFSFYSQSLRAQSSTQGPPET